MNNIARNNSNMETISIHSAEAAAIAREFIGIPFHHLGRFTVGSTNTPCLDCLGLILAVADKVGTKSFGKPLSYYDNLG